MIDQIKKYLAVAEHVALVIALLAAGIWYHNYNSEKAARINADIASKGLAADTLARYTLHDRELLQQIRDAQGHTVVHTIYVPAEGSVTEVVTKPVVVGGVVVKPGATTVVVKTWGLTSRFQYGLVVVPGSKISLNYEGSSVSLPAVPTLNWKYFYYDRWSAFLGVNPIFTGPGVSRHIDDISPNFLHLDNLELGLMGGWNWNGGHSLGISFSTNL